MLLAITITLLLKRYGTQAVALPIPTTTSSAFDAPIFSRDDASDGCNGRAVLDILWSCLATTFACSWVSVHPNVPLKGEGEWTLRVRRIFLMFFSILAPEFMVMWAFKQWRGAVVIREAVNEAIKEASPDKKKPVRELWTTTHGHFLQMGGLRLSATARENFYWGGSTDLGYRTDRPLTVSDGTSLSDYVSHIQRQFDALPSLSGDDLWEAEHSLKRNLITGQRLYRHEEPGESGTTQSFKYETMQKDSEHAIWEGALTIDVLKQILAEDLIRFPTITEDEISDKSKGDALSKGIALLQLTWFIAQIITRAAQGLVITELELTTAALAGLNSAMYIFWWSKPSGVRFPVVIRTKGVEEVLAKRSEDITWSLLGTNTEFDFREYLWTSVITNIKVFGFSVVSLPFGTVSVLLKFVEKAKVFPRRAVHFLSRVSRQTPRTRKEVADEKETKLKGAMVKGRDSGFRSMTEGEEDESRTKSNTLLQVLNCVKRAMKLAALPFYCLFYVIDVVLIIPVSKMIKTTDDTSLSGELIPGYGFSVKAEDEIFTMMFYSEDASGKALLSTAVVAGALFGAVHCLAWHFSFPSHVEQVLWRAASLIVVGSCIATLYTILTVRPYFRSVGFRQIVVTIFMSLGILLSFLAPFVYPTARITLLIIAITTLRSLPPSAFETVDWIEFVPHI